MSRLLVFQHVAAEPLGTLDPLIRRRGHRVRFVNFEREPDAQPDVDRYRGLVVLGVPSNDFGQQEPGSEKEIKEFCEGKYAVDFPLTDKQDVIGPKAHPFFRWISAELGEAGTPRWNFHKYLVGPDGTLEGTWSSSVRPTDRAVTDEIERLLPAKATG